MTVFRMLSAVMCVIALAACGAASTEETATPESAESTQAANAGAAASEGSESGDDRPDGFPVEVDNCGRTLTFDAPPERVVTGYHPSFELMVELGLGDQLIGRTAFNELGPDGAGVLAEHREIYESVPQVSDSIELPAAEEMLALGADFTLSEGWYNFDAERGNATIAELEEAGTAVYITGGWCSADAQLDFNTDILLQDIRNLGMIFGVPEDGEALAAELEGILDDVARATADVDPATVVLIDARPDVLFAMGQGMGAQLAELAGLDNPFADSDSYGEYSAEEIAASNADGFAVLTFLPTTVEERIAAIEETAPNTPAVQDGRYVKIPAIATHPGYRTFLAVRDLAEGFYPDAFGR